jgi:hypothetical protein
MLFLGSNCCLLSEIRETHSLNNLRAHNAQFAIVNPVDMHTVAASIL